MLLFVAWENTSFFINIYGIIAMLKFMPFFLFLTLPAAMAAEPVYSITQAPIQNLKPYNPDAFLNVTLNNKGFELDPMPIFKDPYLKHLNTPSLVEKKSVRILEIGGAYGKLLRETFSKANDKIIKYISYDFCELDQGHVNTAKKIFENKFPLRQDQVNYSVGDALEFLDKTNSTYDIIAICNVIHFLSPTQVLTIFERMKTKLADGGKIYGMAMTPYYNFKRDQAQNFLPGRRCPIIPAEELDRQKFEELRNMKCLFPGYPGSDSPSLGFNTTSASDRNQVDKVNLSIIFEKLGFNFEISEFSLFDDTYYLSEKRWVSFILSAGTKIDPSQIEDLYKRAKIEESFNPSLYKKITVTEPEKLYRAWLVYLQELGVKEASSIKI